MQIEVRAFNNEHSFIAIIDSISLRTRHEKQ